jgi:hypothetical protein
MAPSSLYPRGTLKRITKAHTNRPLSKNVDILVGPPLLCTTSKVLQVLTSGLGQIFLDYMLFMQE